MPIIDWLRPGRIEAPVIELGGVALPIVVRRLAQARRMTLRLAPDGSEVRLSIPRWGRTAEALAFARSRQDWLADQLAKMPRAQAPAPGSMLAYRGATLQIAHAGGARRKPEIAGDTLRIGGPPERLPARLKRWLESEARVLLAQDLAEYCLRADRPLAKLSLTGAQRRWGSCGPSGSIRINWRLIMAPDFVRRSVVAHEVAHLVHFDHSPRFHALLADLFEGDVAEANGWLKREGRSLYAPFG
jgi:predicted metal-dependent hydrolase